MKRQIWHDHVGQFAIADLWTSCAGYYSYGVTVGMISGAVSVWRLRKNRWYVTVYRGGMEHKTMSARTARDGLAAGLNHLCEIALVASRQDDV
jgi:hypothetical protein